MDIGKLGFSALEEEKEEEGAPAPRQEAPSVDSRKLGEVVKAAFPQLAGIILEKVLAFSSFDREGLWMVFPSNHARAWFELNSGELNPSLAYQIDNNKVVVTKK